MLKLVLLAFVCLQSQTTVLGQFDAGKLSVSNGGGWGDWKYEEYCPRGSYASGYSLKVEGRRGKGDDTALNGITLQCSNSQGIDYGRINSQEGPWGSWGGLARCRTYNGQQMFISQFQLKVERSLGGKRDDTAANAMQVKCRPLGSHDQEQILQVEGGPWGTWGYWSNQCSLGTAVCGIRVKIERPRGKGDDTALNDVELFCCRNG